MYSVLPITNSWLSNWNRTHQLCTYRSQCSPSHLTGRLVTLEWTIGRIWVNDRSSTDDWSIGRQSTADSYSTLWLTKQMSTLLRTLSRLYLWNIILQTLGNRFNHHAIYQPTFGHLMCSTEHSIKIGLIIKITQLKLSMFYFILDRRWNIVLNRKFDLRTPYFTWAPTELGV